jgi:hypothetical protein
MKSNIHSDPKHFEYPHMLMSAIPARAGLTQIFELTEATRQKLAGVIIYLGVLNPIYAVGIYYIAESLQ